MNHSEFSDNAQAAATSARLHRLQRAAALEKKRRAGAWGAHANVPRSVPRPPMARFEHRGKAGAVF
jgi:hypothetical protein